MPLHLLNGDTRITLCGVQSSELPELDRFVVCFPRDGIYVFNPGRDRTPVTQHEAFNHVDCRVCRLLRDEGNEGTLDSMLFFEGADDFSQVVMTERDVAERVLREEIQQLQAELAEVRQHVSILTALVTNSTPRLRMQYGIDPADAGLVPVTVLKEGLFEVEAQGPEKPPDQPTTFWKRLLDEDS